MHCAIREEIGEVATLLIEKGADINAVTEVGLTYYWLVDTNSVLYSAD